MVPKLIGFILLPVYTFYLTPEDYGIVDLCGTVVAFLTVVMRLGMPGSVTRFYYDYDEGDLLRNYVTSVFRFIVVASLVIGGVFLLLSYFYIEKIVNGLFFFPFAAWIAYRAILSANTNLQRRLLQAREQSAYSRNLSIAMVMVGVPLSILFVVILKMGLYGAIIASVITSFVFFLQAQYYLRNDLKGQYNSQLLGPSFKYALGVLPSHLIGNIAPMINKSLLASIGSLTAVGLLGVAIKFTFPLTIIGGAFQQAYLPVYLSERTENSTNSLVNIEVLAKKIWFLATIFFLITVLLGPPVLRIMTNKTFHDAGSLIFLLGLGFLGHVIYILFGQEVFFQKKTKWVPLITLAAVSSNILIVIFFVKSFGATALAVGISTSFWSSAIVGYIITNKFIDLKIDLKFMGKTLFLMSIIIALTSFLYGEYIHQVYILITNSLIIAGYTFFIMKTEKDLKITDWWKLWRM